VWAVHLRAAGNGDWGPMAEDEELRRKRQALEERVAQIRRQFVASLPQRVAELQRCWRSCAGPADECTALEALFRAAHTLKGASGTFGEHGIGTAAGTVDEVVRLALERGTGLTADERCQIERAIARLWELAGQAQQSQ
jgi:chemotaxis protein histidine kinase CheA